VKKLHLNLSIVLTGILLGALHYKLKAAPDEKQIQEWAQGMTNRTEWQGRIAPDFELTTISGERFQLSENVGKKIIVLNFFATWCGPCREEMPELNRYFNEHRAESFLLLGVDSEERKDRVDQFLKDLKLDFPAGIDSGPIGKQYGVSALPTTVLIGVDGKVQFYEMGSLANAEVAFDNLMRQNRQLIQAGRVISPEDYRREAQKQPALPVRQAEVQSSQEEKLKLDERGKRIVARMDCPCGCEKKVHVCTCNTSNNIQKALASQDFKDKPDDEIIKALNKRFCGEGM
jgi:thiol-disulfide isomerase/thioredoxin